MSWFPDSLVTRDPVKGDQGLIVRPIFSGSDPGVLTVRLADGSINLSGSFTSTGEAQPSTSTPSSVPYSTTTSIISMANGSRRGLTIYNDSTANLYVFLGDGASLTQFTVKMPPDAYYEVPFPVYTGLITCIWAAGGVGAARVTELTP